MVYSLLRCVGFVLGSIILAISKECQIAELMHIFVCESRNCCARRLRSNMLYCHIIIVDNSSFVWGRRSDRTIPVLFNMLV